MYADRKVAEGRLIQAIAAVVAAGPAYAQTPAQIWCSSRRAGTPG